MLLRFSVENFLSFYDKQEISFDHDFNKANIFKNNTIFEYKQNNKKRSVLNGAIIYGSNASGKSNLSQALHCLKDMYLNSLNFNKKTDRVSIFKKFEFLPSNINPITFEIEFLVSVEDEYYKVFYTFSINSSENNIETESLSYCKLLKTTTSNSIVLFNRTKNNIDCSSEQIKQIIHKVKQENIKYKLVLSLLNFDINESFFKNEIASLSYQIIQACGTSIEKNLVFTSYSDGSSLNEFYEGINKNPHFKEYILSNLYKFDFALSDFEIQDITDEIIDTMLNRNVIENVDRNTLYKHFKQYRVKTIHNINNQQFKLSINAESSGTKKFLMNSLNLFECLFMNKVFVSDEFDSHYHIYLQEGIIKTLIYPEINESKTQFLIITHNPLLLTPNYFAKEQVYFVEKERFTEMSKIDSLKNFENVTYNNHNWSSLYLDGRLGAVPEVFI